MRSASDETLGIGPGPSGCRDGVGTSVERVITPPELRQSEPKTFNQEQWVVLELELLAVSEDNADLDSMSMDNISRRVPQRPVWLKLRSRPALHLARRRQ